MYPAERQRRRNELDAEFENVNARLEQLADLRIVAGDESPADAEGRLLQRLDEIEYDARCLRFLEREGRLPPAMEA